MDDYCMYVPNVTFEKIPIKNLVSNQEYQRNLSAVHIQRAAANFDLYQINPVKVSRRDGITDILSVCCNSIFINVIGPNHSITGLDQS